MSGQIDVMIMQVTQQMIHHWGWFYAFGIALMLLGLAAVVRSVTATVVSMRFFGWLMLFASIVDLVNAFMVGKWGRVLPAPSAGDSFRNNRRNIHQDSDDRRRSCDPGDVHVLSGRRAVSVGGRIVDSPAGLWLACLERSHHLPSGRWPLGATALLGLYAIGLFVGIDLISYGLGLVWRWRLTCASCNGFDAGMWAAPFARGQRARAHVEKTWLSESQRLMDWSVDHERTGIVTKKTRPRR